MVPNKQGRSVSFGQAWTLDGPCRAAAATALSENGEACALLCALAHLALYRGTVLRRRCADVSRSSHDMLCLTSLRSVPYMIRLSDGCDPPLPHRLCPAPHAQPLIFSAPLARPLAISICLKYNSSHLIHQHSDTRALAKQLVLPRQSTRIIALFLNYQLPRHSSCTMKLINKAILTLAAMSVSVAAAPGCNCGKHKRAVAPPR